MQQREQQFLSPKQKYNGNSFSPIPQVSYELTENGKNYELIKQKAGLPCFD